MTEQIGKVTLDYTFYNGQDQYSDGDIELLKAEGYTQTK